VICFGDLCIDVVARTPAFNPALDESDTTIEQLRIRVAGSAANCALAAATAGAHVDVIGLVGKDAFGDMILDKLTTAQIGTSLILRHAQEQTGVVISRVRPNGDRSFLSYRGANAQTYSPSPAHIVTSSDYLYLCGYSLQSEASAETFHTLKSQAGTVLFDPTYLFARDWRAHQKENLAGVHILTPNWEEAQLMTGQTTPADCAHALCDIGVHTVIVKLGPQGCYLHNADVRQVISTAPVTEKADTTGAGDAFCGTLLAHCIKGTDLLQSAAAANEAARNIVCS